MEQNRGFTVGHISLHSCIRAHKIAWTWADETKHLDSRIILLSERLMPGHHAWETYDMAVKLYRNGDGKYQPWQFENAIRTLHPIVDVWHVHNEPDWPVWVLKKHSDKPVIYDIHDLRSIREGKSEEQEDKAFEAANGYSCVSRRYQEIAIKRGGPLKPAREVLSCVPGGMFPKERKKPYRGGIVYEGGLGAEEGAEFACRSWGETFYKILRHGIQVWAYTANPSSKKYPGVIVVGPMPFVTMLNELTMYEFGLVGSPAPDPMFDGALPNKMFEYMAAGLPMICMNAPDAGNFLRATGMGVVVRDTKDIPDAMQYMRDHKFRARVWKNRWNWTMEGQVGKVTRLYEDVTGKKLQKPLVPGEFKRNEACV